MIPETTTQTTGEKLIPLRADWDALAGNVEAWKPSVVVLVARKPPRVSQRLDLAFSQSAEIITDLAIPFVRNELRGARVAVVDDVVNVGSTVRTVTETLRQAGAAEIKIFAIGRVEGRSQVEDLDVEYVLDGPLDARGLARFADRVPAALQALAKPYDLDFPIIPCSLDFPMNTFGDLFAAVVERYGEHRVWDLTTAIGAENGMRRMTIDVANANAYQKVRIYHDAQSGVANVVPLSIGDTLPYDAPPTWDAGIQLWRQLSNTVAEDDVEALARLRLFIDSLALGVTFLADQQDVLSPSLGSLFAVEDARLVFGSRGSRAAQLLNEAPLTDAPPPFQTDTSGVSPFSREARRQGFVDAVISRAGSRDALSIFLATFDELAAAMGAGAPNAYAWDWPYTREEIDHDPYRRLRVGPTSADLAELLHDACEPDCSIDATRSTVSRLLDHFIDAGSVVPTIAIYEGRPYRIYRKGEKEGRVEFADRVEFAVDSYHGDISRTRVAKVVAALAFGRGPDPIAEVQALPRGNVLCFREELFEDAADVTQWMRDTGRTVAKTTDEH